MSGKCSLFIDAGYLLASAASRMTGTSLRSGVHVKYQTLVRGLIQQAEEATGLKVLRVYWYDSAKDGVPDRIQERIGELPKVKLRLGRFGYDGQQKGVDLRLGLDMVTHARNNAAEVFLLVSGDDDLTEAVEDVQIHGVSVAVLAVPGASGQPHGVSRHLVRAADEIITIAPEIIDDAVIPIETPEPIEDEHSDHPNQPAELNKITDTGFVLNLPGGHTVTVPLGVHNEVADATVGDKGTAVPTDQNTAAQTLPNSGAPHLILPPPNIHAALRTTIIPDHPSEEDSETGQTHGTNDESNSGNLESDGADGESPVGQHEKMVDAAMPGTQPVSGDIQSTLTETQPTSTETQSTSDDTLPPAPSPSAITPAAFHPGRGLGAISNQSDSAPTSADAPTDVTGSSPDTAATSGSAHPAPTTTGTAPASTELSGTAQGGTEHVSAGSNHDEPATITRPNPSVVAAALSRLITPTPRSLSSSQSRAHAHLRPTYSTGPDTKPSGTWAHQWESTMEQVVGRVLNSLVKSTTAENWEIIRMGRPSIPQDIDKALLLDATEAMGVYTLSDAERHEVRSTFWREFDQLNK